MLHINGVNECECVYVCMHIRHTHVAKNSLNSWPFSDSKSCEKM